MRKLSAIEKTTLNGKPLFIVASPVEGSRPCLHETIAIDRELYYVEAVQRYTHAGPVLTGERIGLLCTPVKKLREKGLRERYSPLTK